ncbi:MAG: hypothetical protein JNM17_04075 [Archangium sp.]|nr:hypothetical protein [Archangium sp.]
MGSSRNNSAKRRVRLAAAAVAATAVAVSPVVPSVGEVGLDGIGNFAGDIHAENNTKLLYDAAYGSPGSRSWGEWEKLLRTNPFVEMGVDFVSGHIRDARVGVKASEKVADGQKHADFVKWALTEAMDPGVAAVNQQMVEGLVPGFSLHELVWETAKHETLPGGSGYVIKKLADRLTSTVAHNAWHVTGGDLAFVRQQGPDESGYWRTAEIPANKLSLFSWKRRGNNFAGYSAWRSVWYIAKIQEQLLKLSGIALVREGAGIPTAFSDTDRAAKLTDGQRRKLQRLLENLVFHENAAVVMPHGWKIEWVYSPGANKGHVIDAWLAFGKVILQVVQAQQLALGLDGTGNRAVGEVHDAQSFAFIQGVVVELEAVWNGVGNRPYTGIVKKLVDANFGPQLEYPKLTLTLKRPQLQPGARLDALKKAVDAGAFTITADDENVVREDLGFAPIDEKDRDAARELEVQRKAAMAPKFPPGGDGDDPPVPPKKFGANPPFALRRPLRESEKVLDLSAMKGELDIAPVRFETLVRPIVAEMLVQAAPAITAAMADGSPDEVATLPLQTGRLGVAIRTFLTDLRETGNRQVRRELSAGTTDALGEKRADGTPGVKLAKKPTPEQAAAAKADADALVEAQAKALERRMANRLRSELEREAIDVLRTGGTGSEVVSRTVVKQLDTGAFKSDAGTVTTRIWNVGRDEAARLVGGVDTVERSAVLDDGTCEVCERMDGETAPFGSAEHDRLTPPERNCKGGDRCRCLNLYRRTEGSEA